MPRDRLAALKAVRTIFVCIKKETTEEAIYNLKLVQCYIIKLQQNDAAILINYEINQLLYLFQLLPYVIQPIILLSIHYMYL